MNVFEQLAPTWRDAVDIIIVAFIIYYILFFCVDLDKTLFMRNIFNFK